EVNDVQGHTLDIKDLDIVIKELTSDQHLPCSVWRRLGLQLGLYDPRLVDIDKKNRGDPVECFHECMSAWLRGEDKVREKGGPSWSSLATALDTIEEKSFASNIRDKYCTSNMMSCEKVREGRPFLVSDNGHKELTEILSDESLSDISNLSLLGGRDIKELIEIAEEFNTPLTTEPTSQKSSSSTQISESDLDNKGDGGVKCNNNKDKGTTTNTLNESQEHGSTSIEKGQSAGTPNTPTSNDESTSPTKQRTPKEILQEYSAKLSKAIAADVSNVVNALFSNDLIPEGTREYVMTVVGVATADKADRTESHWLHSKETLEKHDKLASSDRGNKFFKENVEKSYFHKSKEINALIQRTEDIMINQLENGNRGRAMAKLRVPQLGGVSSPWAILASGWLMGAIFI
uniref:Death domain-containing protein n=1 Tax=Amphimedon queenslandica TaxID=400682 RepID=A0A1X7TBI9_AMPQE